MQETFQVTASIERINQILQRSPSSQISSSEKFNSLDFSSIKFKNVFFNYPESDEVILSNPYLLKLNMVIFWGL